ncbi:protein pinocchio isoform X1 [Frieseomelitta varia]|uniref:protein pinocchio isoform X1 n=1 Tax=Frieseomelitta varia TaxID=561572 RepID=UPI001CB68D13|nr:protein pinocchio isoform X1 [Frieseomelitta varia]
MCSEYYLVFQDEAWRLGVFEIMESTMTEFEENVSFDIDDPDFAPSNLRAVPNSNAYRAVQFSDITFGVNKFVTRQSSNMSVTTSVQPAAESLSRHGSNISLSCHSSCGSVDDGLQGSHPQYQDTILTIEELRAQLNSCFTCGVSWSEEHVSLDCSECGGYSLQRPCPLCDGRCRASWKRDLTMSHASGKARWIGECGLSCGPSIDEPMVPALEKLRATS